MRRRRAKIGARSASQPILQCRSRPLGTTSELALLSSVIQVVHSACASQSEARRSTRSSGTMLAASLTSKASRIVCPWVCMTAFGRPWSRREPGRRCRPDLCPCTDSPAESSAFNVSTLITSMPVLASTWACSRWLSTVRIKAGSASSRSCRMRARGSPLLRISTMRPALSPPSIVRNIRRSWGIRKRHSITGLPAGNEDTVRSAIGGFV